MVRFYALLYGCSLLLLASSFASADVVEKTFEVSTFSIERMCQQTTITAVNRSLPGPNLNVLGEGVGGWELIEADRESKVFWEGGIMDGEVVCDGNEAVRGWGRGGGVLEVGVGRW
ncbi:hypothetical protein Leryth_001484 [Lithospermum erythrorhizon]|nr:hypothetical protein Leryth_001484 [Lithospermum erythrorhizon]